MEFGFSGPLTTEVLDRKQDRESVRDLRLAEIVEVKSVASMTSEVKFDPRFEISCRDYPHVPILVAVGAI